MSERGGAVARAAWLGLLALGVAVASVAGYLAYEQMPKVVLLRAALGALIGLEVAYGVALALCLAGVPILTTALVRARRRRVGRPWVARGLLLCGSVLIAIVLCEVAASAVRVKRERATAVPAGGLGKDAGLKAAIPKVTEEVDLPTEFPEAKEDDDVDIVVMGESSAMGVPYSLFDVSPGAIVTWRLEQVVPGRKFHLNRLAASGDTLEGQHRLLASLRRRPDVLVVYCGHNEFTARLSAARDLDYYPDAGEPTSWERFVERVEAVSAFCDLVRRAADARRVALPPPVHGNRTLVDTPAYTRAEYDALLADFRRRLEAIVSYAERVGALPVLIAPPSNEADFEPSRSFLPPETPRAERDAFAAAFLSARRGEESDPEGSIRRYRALSERHPGFAETYFRLGRLYERTGAWAEAYRSYVEARDRDGMPMRCPSPFLDVYRDVAARHRCVLIDGPAYFHQVGWHGLLDDHLFHDGMHPSLRGQVAMAQALLRVLHARRAFGWPEGAPAPSVDPAAVARRFALGRYAWSKLCHWGIMFYDSVSPARYDMTERRAKQDAFGKAADKIDAGAPPESVGLPNIGVPAPVPPVPAPGAE